VGVEGKGESIGVFGQSLVDQAVSIVAQGTSSQTANLQEWQKGDGTALTVVDKDGRIGVGTSSPKYTFDLRTPASKKAQMHFSSTDTDKGGYIVSAGDSNFYISGRSRV
jgi:hypothetical protein